MPRDDAPLSPDEFAAVRPGDCYDTAFVAAIFRRSVCQVREWIKDGKLPAKTHNQTDYRVSGAAILELAKPFLPWEAPTEDPAPRRRNSERAQAALDRLNRLAAA